MLKGMRKTMDDKLRLCIVAGKKAFFHRWGDVAEPIPPSALSGGHPGGQFWKVFGIVEYEDGSVEMVYPSKICFTDSSERSMSDGKNH